MADAPSITCPNCHSQSWSLGDIEHRYCGACHQFHDDMFHRVFVHIATLEPLSIYSVSLETDENDNFDEVKPFPVVSHPPLPVDSEEGDVCLAYINLGVMDFGHRDVVFQDGKPIERVYRKDDPIPTWEELTRD